MKQAPQWVSFLREQFPSGTRIELHQIGQSNLDIPLQSTGTLERIDDECNFHVVWDDGKVIPLAFGVDRFSATAIEEQDVSMQGMGMTQTM